MVMNIFDDSVISTVCSEFCTPEGPAINPQSNWPFYTAWPFPSELPPKKPNDQLPQRYNPANDDEAKM
jgi:hypothetical protein